jgi:CubicO group peptidase (beta-lactamase class C family)
VRIQYNYYSIAILMAVLLPLHALAAGTQQVSSSGLERMKSKYAAAANTFIPLLMTDGEVPGMQIAVIQNGKLFYQGAFGVTNEETQQRVDQNTVFAAASLGKPVFAYAVCKLAARGGFNLDRPLAEILPFDKLANNPQSKRITARMILSHSAGIPHTCTDGSGLVATPAKEFHYSPAGYDYLQKVIEKATGLTLNEFVTREVFKPLGMTRSAYYFREDFVGNSVYGHSPKGPAKHISFMSEQQQSAAASLLTTASDYAQFMLAVLKPSAESREMVEDMLTPQVQVHDFLGDEPVNNMYWGLGWGLELGSEGKAVWHWGDLGMFKNYAICFPSRGYGLVYFTNGDSGLAIGRKLTSVLHAGDSAPFDLLGIQDYSAPGWKTARQQQRTYLQGNVSAGAGLYY